MYGPDLKAFTPKMERLIKQKVDWERSRLNGKNVVIEDSFYKELCDPRNNSMSELNYNNLIRLIGYYSFGNEIIQLYKLDELNALLESIVIDSRPRISSKEVEIDLMATSLKDLKSILKGVESVLNDPNHKSILLIPQDILCKYIKVQGVTGISQPKLSKMLTENAAFHAKNIKSNYSTFKLLTQHIRNFTNLHPGNHQEDL